MNWEISSFLLRVVHDDNQHTSFCTRRPTRVTMAMYDSGGLPLCFAFSSSVHSAAHMQFGRSVENRERIKLCAAADAVNHR